MASSLGDILAAKLHYRNSLTAKVTVAWMFDYETRTVTATFTLHNVFLVTVPSYLPGARYFAPYSPFDDEYTHDTSPLQYLNADLIAEFGHYGIVVNAASGGYTTTIGVCVPNANHPLLQLLFECFSDCNVGRETESAICAAIAAAAETNDVFHAARKEFEVPLGPVSRKFGKLARQILHWRARLTDTEVEKSLRITNRTGGRWFAIELEQQLRG